MRRTFPLWICFVLAVVVFTGAFAGSLWTTLNQAAVSSVDEISTIFQANVMHGLEFRLQSVLDEMTLLLNGWVSFPDVERSSKQNVFTYTTRLLAKTPAMLGLYKATPDGEIIGAGRQSDNLEVGYRPPSAMGTVKNLTYWNYNGTVGDVYLTTPFEARVQPVYRYAIAAQGPVFSYTLPTAISGPKNIYVSSALNNSNHTLGGVFAIYFPFSALADQLVSAHRELRSSGIMLLMEQNTGMPIATATASPTTLDADIAEIQAIVQGNTQSYSAQHTRLRTFGGAVVLQALISPTQASGLHWKVVVVLPDADYYSKIWHQNVVTGAVAGGILLGFLLILIVMSHFLVSRPLRMLERHIDQMRVTLLGWDGLGVVEASARNQQQHDSSPVELPAVAPEMMGTVCNLDLLAVGAQAQGLGCSSFFTEVKALYGSVVAALEATSEVSQQRAMEASQTAELRRAEEQTRALMRAKESFFAVMSHEMRTPLTACIGMAEVLRDTTELDLRQSECVEAVISNGGSMLSLINDILDFSPREVVEQAAAVVQVKAE
eukprot:RCo028013